MPEVKVQKETKVVLQMTEVEAMKLKDMLSHAIDWEREPLAEAIYDAFTAADIESGNYEYKYSKASGLFVLA